MKTSKESGSIARSAAKCCGVADIGLAAKGSTWPLALMLRGLRVGAGRSQTWLRDLGKGPKKKGEM